MADTSQSTLLGLSPTRYGFASVISACIGGLCGVFLLPVIGWVLWFLVLALFLVFAIVCGLLSVGTGLYYKHWLGTAIGAIGLAITGCGVWFVMGALTKW